MRSSDPQPGRAHEPRTCLDLGMPIVIGRDIRNALPAEQRLGLDDYLWAKSSRKCHLCGEALNRASDRIEADHDEPSSTGGATTRENLALAHAACNKAKLDHPSVDMRPYLRFAAFVRREGGLLRYGGCLKGFGIVPKPIALTDTGDSIRLELPDGTIQEVSVQSETNRKGTFRFFFADLPREAIHNDSEVQPRTIKVRHVGAIYADLQENPLHEPPGLRAVGTTDATELRMFDGQHKTIATWMCDRDHIQAKVYLDLSTERANYLVNSIQSAIKKLPLSPFELVAKMSEEFRDRWTAYEAAVGAEGASEAEFIKWLSPAERRRGKAAFESALVRNVLESDGPDEFLFLNEVATENIKEATFRGKVLKPLICMKPLGETGEAGVTLRTRERDTIVRLLNKVAELVLAPAEATGASDQEKDRAARMRYQAALEHNSKLLRSLVRQITAGDDDNALFGKVLTTEDWDKIHDGIERLINHPIWTADWNHSPKTRAVYEALQKNQNAPKAFSDVGLRVGYLVGADPLASDCLD